MKTTDFIKESQIADDAHIMHVDHEIQMAREECYHSAANAIKLHKLLKQVSEQDGIDAWASEKITLANDYLRTVCEWLEYELMSKNSESQEVMPAAFDEESAEQMIARALSESAKPQDVAESKSFKNSKTIITEALVTQKLWEDAGKKLMEAQLTVDQISQIFQQIEKGANASGSNRTMLGKGKDAAVAVNKAWEDLKTKVQNSGPIKNMDATYDAAAEKLKQATGGDQGVMKYIQYYRDFAKKHPIAQSLIYSALIAAAGISGVGLGGAAALGLFKMVDKLLQGEKFSSAAYSGAKTGATAYAAGQIGQYLKGQPPGGTGNMSPDIQKALAADQSKMDWFQNKFPPGDGFTYDGAGKSLKVFDAAGNKVFQGDIPFQTMNANQFAGLAQNGKNVAPMLYQGSSISSDIAAGLKESVNLSESQIFLLIGYIVENQNKLDEGVWDSVKGAAGKAMNWAQTKGANLTNKITADKLLQTWKKAGSPLDSETVAKIIHDAGVPFEIVNQAYSSLNTTVAATPKTNPNAQVAQPTNKAATAQGYNASNVMKLPGMEKYVKPGPAKTPNFGVSPTGYANVNTTFKAPTKPVNKATVLQTAKPAMPQGMSENSEEQVGFHLDTELAYQAVMRKFGNVVSQDPESGTMYVPASVWTQVEQVAFDADGRGAEREEGVMEGFTNDVDTVKHRIAVAKEMLDNPKTSFEMRQIASRQLSQYRRQLSQYKDTEARYKGVAEGLKSMYHNAVANHHGRKADDAFDNGDEEGFKKSMDKNISHKLKAGEKIPQVRDAKKFQQGVAEEWSQKYKSSIDCSHPKGFSQKAHCAGKKKHNESIEMEVVCPDCGMCEAHGNSKIYDKCWTGFRKVPGKKRGEEGSCEKIGEDASSSSSVSIAAAPPQNLFKKPIKRTTKK